MGYNGFAFILEKPDSATTKLAKQIRHGAHDKKKRICGRPPNETFDDDYPCQMWFTNSQVWGLFYSV